MATLQHELATLAAPADWLGVAPDFAWPAPAPSALVHPQPHAPAIHQSLPQPSQPAHPAMPQAVHPAPPQVAAPHAHGEALRYAHAEPLRYAPVGVAPARRGSLVRPNSRGDGIFALAASLLVLAIVFSAAVAMEGGLVHHDPPKPAKPVTTTAAPATP
ncbi:MAG: hypothetical protein JWM98_980 [Thermoleophilia bacterium]|nr:hypothetical protein [Thermoleophilia bacterium]